MSLRYRYKLVPTSQPVVPLGGRFVRPRPVIHVAVVGPRDTFVREALLDTGADDTVFHESIAARIGIDLTGAPSGIATGVTLAGATLRYAEVKLRLATNQERREWRAWVGFTPARLAYPTLGFAGCLQFFDAHFFGALEEIELTANAFYPGI